MKPILLILAAGLGSRYGGIKQMDKLGPSGESIIDYSIYDAIRAGFGKVVFVINKKIENDFKEIFEPKLKGKIKTEYVLQKVDNLPTGFKAPENRKKPWGTAHAILAAKDVINKPFAVINADDFYGKNSYKAIVNFFANNQKETKFCMVGFQLGKTISESGTVSRGVCSIDKDAYLTKVVEHTMIQKVGNNIEFINDDNEINSLKKDMVVSMNFWGFTPLIFKFIYDGFKDFLKDNIDNPTSEYYIPTIVSDLIASNVTTVSVLENTDQWFGITYQEDRSSVVKSLNQLIKDGVYPNNIW
jgi:UTP-glucose-1-phosphate uridylyltransferase